MTSTEIESASCPREVTTVDVTSPPVEVEEARGARLKLESDYSDDLPRLVSMWLMAQRSPNTRRAYARSFIAWSNFCRSVGVHPMSARRPHADAYMRAMEQTGTPNTTACARLSAASSFYAYAIDLDATDINPVGKVKRPRVDPDHSDTQGLTEDEMVKLLLEAKRLSPRAYALCMLMYTVGLRVDGALSADVSSLGYDSGHRTLTIRLKGGAIAKKALPPVTAHALDEYLSGRTDGPLFSTRTGARLREPEVWKMLRRLARKAGLPQAGSIHPHVMRHCYITHGLDKGVPLHVMQDSVDHKDPRTTRRYDRIRGRLTNSPAYTVGSSIAEKLEDSQP